MDAKEITSKDAKMDENECSNRILGAAIEVHRVLGPGLMESAYRRALTHELRAGGMQVESEVVVGIRYKNAEIPGAIRLDLLVENVVIVELKSVEKLALHTECNY